MLDSTGKPIPVGAQVAMHGMTGRVVCSIDTNEFTAEFPASAWKYLDAGIMVDTMEAGLVHVTDNWSVKLIAARAE